MDVFSVCLNERQGARLRHHMAEFVEFCQKRPNCFSEEAEPGCFASPPTARESSRCSTSSAAFGEVSVLGFHHSDRCAVVARYYFNSHFSRDISCYQWIFMLPFSPKILSLRRFLVVEKYASHRIHHFDHF